MSSLLEMMPDVVMKKILKECGFVAIQRLRKTCHTLRNFIDDFPPDPLITEVSIGKDSERITLCFSFSKFFPGDFSYLIYQKVPYGTLLKDFPNGTFLKWDHQKVIKNMHPLHVFCQDFELLLRGQKSIIEFFKIGFEYYNSDNWEQYEDACGEELWEKLENILPEKPKLKVKNLELIIPDQEGIMAILPFLDEKSIESLKFIDAIGTQGERVLNIEKIIELPHWKSARALTIAEFSVSAPIQNFFHFENCSIYLESISIDDINLIKNNSQNSPNFIRFAVNFNLKINEHSLAVRDCEKFLFEKYGVPYIEDGRENTWFFKKDKETVLNLLITPYSIVFERIRKERVPEGCSIWE
ncbi:hypothetical protein CAEBREN_04407 [Caenorhabditis brenneri]|uniref:F-box domain-containing protein n=1 Tax=Caenorhabditis brenneri TaxID=135651 RepID=G0N1F8_CAEBE|nr:hypothetical protein CAEBREN_04407 [Caenorhabditis brenneri]